jgi:hypothetical protein
VADLARLLARRAEALRGLRSDDEVKALLQEALRCAERSPGRPALEAKADAALAMVRAADDQGGVAALGEARVGVR